MDPRTIEVAPDGSGPDRAWAGAEGRARRAMRRNGLAPRGRGERPGCASSGDLVLHSLTKSPLALPLVSGVVRFHPLPPWGTHPWASEQGAGNEADRGGREGRGAAGVAGGRRRRA